MHIKFNILGIDDAPSECDLDDQLEWDWVIQNNKRDDLNDFIIEVIKKISTEAIN